MARLSLVVKPLAGTIFLETRRYPCLSPSVKSTLRHPDAAACAPRRADLRSPPGNRLEALKGNLAEFHSIRVNERWRVIFRWTDAGPLDVNVVDYH